MLALAPFAGLEPPYDVIVADPPWRFATYSPKGKEKKSAELHYSTMTLDDIKALPVRDLAAKDCALFLWATAPMFPQALDVAAAWGFKYSTFGNWVKTTKGGGLAFKTGYRLRNCHEPYILATRGAPKNTRSTRSCFLAEAREHSRKPDEFLPMVECWASAMPGARFVELFSRTDRPGWHHWGNEVGKFNEERTTNAKAI